LQGLKSEIEEFSLAVPSPYGERGSTMIYDEFELADGRIATFTDLNEGDLRELISVYNSVVEEEEYFLRNEGLSSIEDALEWFHKRVKAGMTYIAVKVNGDLVGGATIEPREGKASHVSYFGIYLRKEFRNLGIGTRLTRKIIELARQKKFEIIQLYVFASNKQAIHIYNKLGFKEAGRIKNGVKLPDGTYTDEIVMTLHLWCKT